jgi:branched-chain amino acid transport system substrate-binding protein
VGRRSWCATGAPWFRGVAILVLVAGVLAACGNVTTTAVTHAGDTDGVTAKTITVGGMGSLSGVASSDFAPVITGVRMYFDRLNATGGVDGRKIVYAPVIDDGTSPSGDTAAAQRLVQDKVFAVVGVGTPFFTGSSILRAQSIPTFGLQENTNAQWAGPTMFGAGGSFVDSTAPMPQVAYVAQRVGARRAAVLAYNIAQSSEGCVSIISALKKFHIDTPVIDTSIPYGAATLDADVTRMQANGVDFVASCMDATGDIKLSQTLQQHGMGSVAQYWLDGYDQQTLDNNTAAMDGVYYLLQQTPFEVSARDPGVYPGIDAFNQALRRYAPLGTEPSAPLLAGWVSADLFVKGLRAVGHDVTRSRVVDAINAMTAYTGDGAIPPVNWNVAHTAITTLDCNTFVQARGDHFVPVFGTRKSVYVCFDQQGPAQATVTTLPVPSGVPGG